MNLKLLLTVLLLFTTAATGQLRKIGLGNSIVTSLTIADNSYYGKIIAAGTEGSGLYFHEGNSDDTVWIQVFFRNRTLSSVYAQRIDSGLTKLFMAQTPDASSGNNLIYSNILPIQSAIPAEDSGLDRSRVHIIKSMAGFDYISKEQPMPLFCCTNDPCIYKYSDRIWSKSWTGPDIVNFNFVHTSESTVWAGGVFNGFIATPFLLKSTDYGVTWDTLSLPIGEVHSCYSICVSPFNSDVVFAGLNENIIKSTDGGKSWSPSLPGVAGTIFTSIIMNPLNNAEIFAGGKTLDGYYVFFKSVNEGQSWDDISKYRNCIIKGINSMAGSVENNEFALYWATDGDGIYKYSEKVVGVERYKSGANNFCLLQNYPNPFNPSTRIIYSLPANGRVLLKITDILGRDVRILKNGYQQAGTHEINYNASGSAGGIYFVVLKTGEYTSVIKMIQLK